MPASTETTAPSQDSRPENGGTFGLKIIKYDTETATPLAGGNLATVPSHLEKFPLGKIRAYLLIEKYMEKEDANKPFCTKEGLQVRDDMSFDAYVQENPKHNTAASPTTTDGDQNGSVGEADRGGKSTKHNIYILTKKRTKTMAAAVEDFIKKPVDLSNSANVDFATASTGAPLTSSFTHKSWAAEDAGSIIHPANMTENEWGIVMRNNNLLSGQFLKKGPVENTIKVPGHEDIRRPTIDVTDVEKAYYPAFALRPRKLPGYDITFNMTRKEDKENPSAQNSNGENTPSNLSFRIPRFHIKDASQVRVFETKGSFETSMAESSFSEDSIEAVVGGTAFGVSAAVKGGASWSNDNKSASSRFNDTNYMHVVYEFPRVELILNEENVELSEECKADIDNLRDRRTVQELGHFERRYGTFFARRVQLGGKLVSIDESDSVAGANSSEKTKMLKAAAGASVSGFGYQAEVNYSHTENSGSKTTSTEKKMTHSMSWSAEGGETTLCNNPPKWCPTVTSFYNWRVMKQDDVVNIYKFIGRLPGYEFIPQLVQNILQINQDPRSLVQFSLHLSPNAELKQGARTLSFGQPAKRDVAPLEIHPASIDPPPTPHREELISDVTLSKKSESPHLYGTVFGIPISADQKNIHMEKSTKSEEKGIVYPRLKYGVKYPIHYLVNEKEDDEMATHFYSLQIKGDGSSNPTLYGKHDQAANVMVEFVGKRKGTLVGDYGEATLRFSSLQDTTIHHVSNFQFKDLDCTRPERQQVTDSILATLPPEPKKPDVPNMNFDQWRQAYKDGSLDLKKDEDDRKKFYEYLHADADYMRRRREALKSLPEKMEALEKEWEERMKELNGFPDFGNMVFTIEYCNTDNAVNLAKQMEAAQAALEAKNKAQADELEKEANTDKKNAEKAAVEKAEKLALEKRIKCLLNIFFRGTKYDWVTEKRRLEGVAQYMDQEKANRLREDIKKKDDALTMCAKYDLDLSLLEAHVRIILNLNPFYKDAVAEVHVSE